MVRAYLREIGAVFAGVVFVIAAYGAGALIGADTAHADPCPGESGETSSCWISYYEKIVAADGSHAALLDLKMRYEAQESAATFCHPLLHIIGAAAGAEYGSVSEAYKYGETFCRSGYYHGVLEGLFGHGGGNELLAKFDSFCADVDGRERYSYDYFSCVHGIGHGAMAFFDHDIFKSLAACDQLSGAWEKSSCHGGVFMENVISDSVEEPSKFLKKDDPLYPCNAVGDEYRAQCYLMQTSHMLALFDGDFKKTFAVCGTVEEKHRTTCYQSIGRDASGWSYGSIESVLGYCGYGETSEEYAACVVGAAVDFIQSESPDAAQSLCTQAEEGARERCTEAIDVQIRAL